MATHELGLGLASSAMAIRTSTGIPQQLAWHAFHACIVNGKSATSLLHRAQQQQRRRTRRAVLLLVLPPSSRRFTTFSSSATSVETTSSAQEQEHEHEQPGVSGDAIRRTFLNFFAARGHHLLPGSSLVPDDPTVLLTIAGMLQFKPIFLGQVPRRFACAVTSQKCLRTNDIENVGRTSRHHTFFEMLGNFSFGDYFKHDAIRWAWELATSEYKLPAARVWVSVYKDDDEALAIWRDHVGIPEERIKKLGEEDNFWASGPTGPCGPCSEMYFDFHPERGTDDADLGDDTRFLEFYNLVFMQYNRNDDGKLELLKQKNIDTGLGLERMARILQKVPNNYETDLIYPIIQRASELAGVNYTAADDRTKTYLKVIGDHSRAVVYLISDGVTPSNIGRGYIVRRLIRRIVRMGRLLGIRGDGEGNSEGTFLPSLAKVVVSMSSNVDPDVKQNAGRIFEELDKEELRFVQTLERGEKLLSQKLEEAAAACRRDGSAKPVLSGKDVFMLYDTYGFPVEITEEVAGENDVQVDMAGFETEMEYQRRQSQEAHNVVKLSAGGTAAELTSLVETKFVGYTTLESIAEVRALIARGGLVTEVREGDEVEIVLDTTPFYAESGGQIGDNGLLVCRGGETDCIVQVKDVQKLGSNLIIHKGIVQQGTMAVGNNVQALVESSLRRRAQAQHTATHLLQAALKKVLGSETSQAGSLVAFDRLRFDFTLSRKMAEEEVVQVEALVNEWISMAVPLEWKVMPLAEAKNSGAIAMFGEKYGEQVRVVDVPGISKELCGGTHVSNTSEIRGFKIVLVEGIASGVKRIEAVAGDAFIDHIFARENALRQICSSLKAKPEDLPARISGLQDELKALKSDATSLRAKVAIAEADVLTGRALLVGPGGVRILVGALETTDVDSLRAAVEHCVALHGDPSATLLGACTEDGKVSLVAAFSPSVVKHGLKAGAFVGSVAKLCGGGGGGRPDFAQAGGKLPDKLPGAIEKAKADLLDLLAGFQLP
ncbi:alanine--tRNA ligase, chloroplastic/mitochondrial [Selaginella moellendorffii]|uniref:alanine--tRNA ligase, chloroplastic/mitochondrial n=1 Tax=Selaginella moellendorffii TaxID=88036 RepID=UPI000D1CDD25|nr:alanine--tRNA ligase, chloroplastic/mitochondrial [Selaginella moellendorffii]|eukprot:XP_024543276.1 alanine--tRNA ligase, chloroplastic/mitochondrial [Selaginella moellendorffii]